MKPLDKISVGHRLEETGDGEVGNGGKGGDDGTAHQVAHLLEDVRNGEDACAEQEVEDEDQADLSLISRNEMKR